MLLARYDSLALYDEDPKKRFIVDNEKLQLDKNYGWDLIGIREKPDGNLADYEYFCIYLIEFNNIIRIKISFGSLYQMNQIKTNIIVNQQRYVMTRSNIRRGVFPKINQSYSSEKKAGNYSWR